MHHSFYDVRSSYVRVRQYFQVHGLINTPYSSGERNSEARRYYAALHGKQNLIIIQYEVTMLQLIFRQQQLSRIYLIKVFFIFSRPSARSSLSRPADLRLPREVLATDSSSLDNKEDDGDE